MSEDGNRFLKIAVGCGVLAAGLGVGSYYGVYVPQLEREKLENAEKSRIAQRKEAKDNYRECTENSGVIYLQDWASNCSLVGIGSKKPGCSLPATRANELNKDDENRRQTCLEILKAEM